MHDNRAYDKPDPQRIAAAHRATGQVDIGLREGEPIQLAHLFAYAEAFLFHYLAMKPKLWTPGRE